MSEAVEQVAAETPPPTEEAVLETAAADTTETPEAERDVESDTLEIPDSTVEGGKARYVPASALAGARSELKELKGKLASAEQGSAKASQLEQQIAALTNQVQQMQPYVQAYQAAIQQPTQQQPAAEDDTEARELAQTLDLYTVDGQPDLAKAKKLLTVVERRASAKVQQEVQPIHLQTAQQQSHYNLQRALNTDVNGVKADPDILRTLWNRMPVETTRDPESAKHLLIQALGMSVLQGKAGKAAAQPTRGADGKFAADATVPPPLHAEKAGGGNTNAVQLSSFEKQIAKDMGLSEAEYIKRADSAPWLRK